MNWFNVPFNDLVYKYSDIDNKENGRCRSVTIQLTSECNLRCDYCYECHKENKFMSQETIDKVCDFLLNDINKDDGFLGRKNLTGLVIDFIGGEPLLCIDEMEYIIDKLYFGIAKIRPELLPYLIFSISTNGLLVLTDKAKRFFKKYQNILNISVSIDGIKELHDAHRVDSNGNGSFDKAYEAFTYLKKTYGNVNNKMTFVPESIKYLKDSVIFLIKEGAPSIHCNFAYEPVYTYSDAANIYESLTSLSDFLIDTKSDVYVSILDDHILGQKNINEGNYCGGTGSMLAIDVEGNFYPCIRYCPVSIGEDKAKNILLGNFNEGLYATKKTLKVRDYLDSITYNSQSSEECINCPISGGCGWCSGYNYQVTGDVNKRVTNICNAHKARVLSHIYYYNKRYLLLGDKTPVKNNVPIEWQSQILTQEQIQTLKELEEKAFNKLNN